MCTPEALTSAPIRLRPHHLLCVRNFRGKGYSPDFVRKMTEIRDLFYDGRPASIHLTAGADDLCSSCPHCENGKCSSPKPFLFDALVLKRTGLESGSVLENGLRSPKLPQVTEALLDECCPGCTWLAFCKKICTEAIP